MLIKVGNGLQTFHSLQKLGVITRPMAKNLSEYLRISIGTKEENEKALKALKQVIAKGVGI